MLVETNFVRGERESPYAIENDDSCFPVPFALSLIFNSHMGGRLTLHDWATVKKQKVAIKERRRFLEVEKTFYF